MSVCAPGGTRIAAPAFPAFDPAALTALEECVRATATAQRRPLEAHAHLLVLASLPRRLRWMGARPRGLRLLRRLQLWRPPCITVRSDGTLV